MKPGTIILVRKTGLLPAGIRFFMRIYGRRKVRYNHAELVIGSYDYVVGAIKGGVKIREFEQAQKDGKWKEMAFYEPIKPLSDEEIGIMITTAIKYNKTPYQIMNFVQWIIYIRYGFWLGKKSDNKVYCYESVARLWNAIRPGTFKNDPEITSIWDFIDNENFKVKHTR